MVQGDDIQGVEAAIAAIARGAVVVVTDDDDRENEADLVVAADAMTVEIMNFMVTHGRGLVCAPMESRRLDALGLRDMVPEGNDPLGTRFTISVDLEVPGSTGISAGDRSATVRALADHATTATQLRTPGHIFPLRYAEGGVLVRRGHTEASVDLARLAGRAPAAAICEILADDGTTLTGSAVREFAAKHGLVLVSIEQLAAYRRTNEPLRVVEPEQSVRGSVKRVVETTLPTETGLWRAIGYRDMVTGAEHLALVLGDVAARQAPLVRLHSECLTGDVIGSLRCDCGQQLEKSFQTIAREGAGVVLYIGGHEGRGIGLLNKLRAYALQDRGRDTVDANLELGLSADSRTYDQSIVILQDLGLTRVWLLTNNPVKIAALQDAGIAVDDVIPLRIPATLHSAAYLLAKARRMGHRLGDLDETYPHPASR
ncbi:3,4-dihydroxy-2-butanone-4-phosphate synthase [Amycolatopsis carbonis]|uniref:GTP cyclohydrolase-2 n=1 Tax=Amycolatopsis carbonis TaxID=715471 RepID=A0A9Y2MP60_9PSEU|nr:3,4-dihydroxy-2-butanone-4-phosphate synthase [Amycolatopsis sp. 2-15]WIX75640.1 3,4-dihydroxy-2-butanone-4-phosphate synthase [Amycolatopsis sp. 2-15]